MNKNTKLFNFTINKLIVNGLQDIFIDKQSTYHQLNENNSRIITSTTEATIELIKATQYNINIKTNSNSLETVTTTTTTSISSTTTSYQLPILIGGNGYDIENSNENEIRHNDNNNNFPFEECMDPWAYNAAAITLFFIGFFGFTFNAIVIVLMCKHVKQWTPTNVILLNLVCSDFSVSIFGNPLTLVAAISHHWIFGRTLCIMYGFFMSLLGITSITTLTVLAYERYCLIKFPLSATRISNRSTVIRIIFIWSYSLALTAPPLFGWGAYVNEAANISCSVNWESKTFNATTYIVFLFIFGLVIPLFVITYSYVKIISTMKTSAIRLGRKNRAEKRINIMVGVMIFAFMLAWTPYSAFALLEQFGPIDLISPQMAVLPALIAKSSICYNPLIYVGLNTQLRNTLRKKLHKETTANDTTINQLSQIDNGTTKICTKFKILISQNNNKNILTEMNENKSTNRIDNDIMTINCNDNESYDDRVCEEINLEETCTNYMIENKINNKIINLRENNVHNIEKYLENENEICENYQYNYNLSRISSIEDDTSVLDNITLNNEIINNTLNKNETEMTVFIGGKSKLINSDLFLSNIC